VAIKILPRRKSNIRRDRFIIARRGKATVIWDHVNACVHSNYNGISEARHTCDFLNNQQRINEQRYGNPPLWSGEYEHGRYERQIRAGYRHTWY